MNNNNEEKEAADLSARLDESELLQPGTTLKPGTKEHNQSGPTNDAGATGDAGSNSNIEKDVSEYNNFVALQEAAGQEIEKPKNGTLHIIWEISKTVLIAAAVVIFINTFVFFIASKTLLFSTFLL